MRRLLGDHWADPLTNQRAFETSPEYRTIAHRELAKAPFSKDLFDGVRHATEIARQSPCSANHSTTRAPGSDWVSNYRSLDYSTLTWLRRPARIVPPSGIGEGRRRLTYLRVHHGPEHSLLVRVDHSR
jgi:hypothetical protein